MEVAHIIRSCGTRVFPVRKIHARGHTPYHAPEQARDRARLRGLGPCG